MSRRRGQKKAEAARIAVIERKFGPQRAYVKNNPMSPDQLRYAIRCRAGVTGKRVDLPVRIVDLPSGRLLPLSLRPKHRKTFVREVVVSTSWLRLKAPKLWAAFTAARLLNLPDRLHITTLKEELDA